MSSFKPTREFMLTPRECCKCGQLMSAELLAERKFKTAEKISAALRRYNKQKCVEDSDTTNEQYLPRSICTNIYSPKDLK